MPLRCPAHLHDQRPIHLLGVAILELDHVAHDSAPLQLLHGFGDDDLGVGDLALAVRLEKVIQSLGWGAGEKAGQAGCFQESLSLRVRPEQVVQRMGWGTRLEFAAIALSHSPHA